MHKRGTSPHWVSGARGSLRAGDGRASLYIRANPILAFIGETNSSDVLPTEMTIDEIVPVLSRPN
jgi:hypothetical protein